MPTASQVFTPTGIPTFSYVERESEDYEGQLKTALNAHNGIVSLSGPSKSGKTVLLRRVVDPNDLIEVTGANIRSPDDLWYRILAWCGSSVPESVSTVLGGSLQASAKGSGSVGIPLLAEGKAEAGGAITGSYERSSNSAVAVDLISLVAREIANSSFVVFVDDFHYIPRTEQVEIAKQIKAASERGIKIVLASVPHRSDDAVRANSELRGRVEAIDIRYWDQAELAKIAANGFKALNAAVNEQGVAAMARESFGSPQLMQAICLQACLRLKVDDHDHDPLSITLSSADRAAIFQSTTARSNFRSLLEALHAGPRQRGTERKEFPLTDGSKGDVYRTILVALREGEGNLSLTYDQILERVRTVCADRAATPSGSSIQTSLEHMSKIASDERHRPAVLEWDEDRLDLVDPYFLFYLRNSSGLADLRKQ